MKSKYEISVWSDIYDSTLGRFIEQKEIIIGSDTMTSESRARNPKMVSNINGTNKFTFSLYYTYIDTRTGEEIKNPYIPYLVNERKIKVLWKDEWYDLLVKQIKEDQVGHVFNYTCEDSYITELSRTGFELEFNTELENNIGTAKELIEKTLENTDWTFDKDGSDKILQETEEPVYEATVLNNFIASKNPSQVEQEIQTGFPILIYYSCAHDKDNLKENCQFYYCGNTQWQQDQNDMLVINGDCYSVSVKWSVSENIATASINNNDIFTINLSAGLSKNYRANRLVESNKTIYNNIVERYVNVYNNGELLGYSTTEYNDALAVVNLITNASNFKNVSGWTGQDLIFKLSPTFGPDTQIATYESTSFLKLTKNQFYFNSGIQNNRSYIQKGLINGDRYVFRIKAHEDGPEPCETPYVHNPNNFEPSIQSRDANYQPAGVQYFEITSTKVNGDWVEYNMTCIKSCPYKMLISSLTPFGIFIKCNKTYWVEDIQFFKEVYGSTGYDDQEPVRIDPGAVNVQSIAQVVYRYFDANQKPDITKDELCYIKTTFPDPWNQAIPVTNEFEKYGTIEESNSNRFNILQTIAETFECWIKFVIEHDDNGYIKYNDDGAPCKYVQIKKEVGEETGIGFIYGIDLKGVTRDIKSNQISTKTIVRQNENEFGKNGFCSIARSDQNYPRENYIYNFDYYIQQGLLDSDALYDDLYNSNGMNYYGQLHSLNTEYQNNLYTLLTKKNELIKQGAMGTVYHQYVVASLEEKYNVEESIMKLAGVNTFFEAQMYAQTHCTNTKIQSLFDDRSNIIKTIKTYETLNDKLNVSLDLLKDYISTTEARQKEIIEQLKELNKQFYFKYSRFIQEGTWSSEDYWDDDLYYLDALQVAYTSSRPQISYEINVLRLSDLDDYSSKIFNLGDISFVQDTKYFGYQKDRITPYKEKVFLSEITSYFDTPDKDVLKVQNYKTQFDDLFNRITAATQALEFSSGKYSKAANIINSDGTIKSSVIQNTFDTNKDLVYGAQNESATIDNTGITVANDTDPTHLVKITSGGVFITNDGGNNWKNAIRGDGISTDLLTAGRINVEEIMVYNGDYPSFRWDPNGINAYKFTSSGVDTTQFIRFDQYGLYGCKNIEANWVPSDEDSVYHKASFGLTWNRFFMKNSSGGRKIEISTDRDIVVSAEEQGEEINRVVIGRIGDTDDNYGIVVRNQSNDITFQCDNNGSFLSGWRLNNTFLESTASGSNNIKIYSDGNIGCYGNEPHTSPETAYIIQSSNKIDAKGLNAKDIEIPAGSVIYPFTTSIGTMKTQYQISGRYNSRYDIPTSEYRPNPPKNVQIVYNYNGFDYNYMVNDIDWTSVQKPTTHVETAYGSGDTTTYVTTYTYTFDLQAKKNNILLFYMGLAQAIKTNMYRHQILNGILIILVMQFSIILQQMVAQLLVGGLIMKKFIRHMMAPKMVELKHN